MVSLNRYGARKANSTFFAFRSLGAKMPMEGRRQGSGSGRVKRCDSKPDTVDLQLLVTR